MDKLKQAFSYTKASQQKEKSKEKQKEAKRKTEDSSCSLLWHFWSTSRSPFSTCYIPFQSSGSQESNASNCVRFEAEIRKIWPSEDNCIKPWEHHFARRFSSWCEIWPLRTMKNHLAKFRKLAFHFAKFGPFIFPFHYRFSKIFCLIFSFVNTYFTLVINQ